MSDTIEVLKEIILTTPDVDYVPDPAGMGVAFYNKMKSHGDAIAQVCAVTGEKDTYESLLQRSIRTAIKMRSLGVTSSDIVTICSINHLNSCVPLVASMFLGAKIANLDPAIPVKDALFLLQQVQSKLIFAGEEAISLMEAVLVQVEFNSTIVVFGKSTRYLEFSSFLHSTDDESDFKPVIVNNKETACIYFSSGTTGLPKGICLSHSGILGVADIFCNRLGLTMDVILSYSTMYWVTSISFITAAILNQKCRLICPAFIAEDVLNLIGKYKVSFALLAPIQAIHMCKAGRPSDADTSCFKQLIIGGGTVARGFLEEIRQMLPETYVFNAYGQTEASGIISCFYLNRCEDIPLMKEKYASSGRIIPGMTYKVVDPETGQTLGPHQKGELRLKSNYLMNGYHNRDCSEAWDNEGYLKTGDVVYYDEDYCIYIVDRIKDMLKYQRWHIPPALLEGILLAHPSVHSAVVIGLPHPVDGDHPMGIVVLKDSYIGKITSNVIRNFVDEQVGDKQKLRGGVKIVGQLPCTPSGKFKKTYIRDLTLRGEL